MSDRYPDGGGQKMRIWPFSLPRKLSSQVPKSTVVPVVPMEILEGIFEICALIKRLEHLSANYNDWCKCRHGIFYPPVGSIIELDNRKYLVCGYQTSTNHGILVSSDLERPIGFNFVNIRDEKEFDLLLRMTSLKYDNPDLEPISLRPGIPSFTVIGANMAYHGIGFQRTLPFNEI